MPDAVTLSESSSDVARRRLSIGVDAFCANDGIEGLESLCCKDYRWAKASNVVWEVNEQVELGLVEPSRRPLCCRSEEVMD